MTVGVARARTPRPHSRARAIERPPRMDAVAARVRAMAHARDVDALVALVSRASDGASVSAEGAGDADARARALRARGAPPPWDEICGAFAAARASSGASRVQAYEAHARGVRELVKAFRGDDDGAWMTRAMATAADDARAVAIEADEEMRARGEKPSRLADCGSTLMLVYRAVSQTSNAEKKAPQLRVVNGLFKVYFRLNALHLCKNLINAVNLPTFLPFDSFPKAEKVTYNFYVGRLAVFEIRTSARRRTSSTHSRTVITRARRTCD